MKIGVRKPSIKKSFSARTTGKLKRNIKKTVNPLYGKKGMGLVNDPKKVIYNKVYNKTTIGVSDIINSDSNSNNSFDNMPDELLEEVPAYEKFESNTSSRTWKICGFLMRGLAVICAIIFALPGLLAGLIPLFIISIIASVAMWLLGSCWIKIAVMCKESENTKMQNVNTIKGSISVYNVETHLANKSDPTPVSLGKYANNTGGFTNWTTYEITALNPATKRKNKRRYQVVSEEYIKELAEKEGLVDVEITNIIPHESPTEKQLNYAKDLGLTIPDGACKEDVSEILSRLLDSNDIVNEVKVSNDLVRNYVRPLESPTTELAIFACEQGICFSSYISEKALIQRIISNLNIQDKFAFYAYCIVCNRNNERIENMSVSPLLSQFYQFADNSVDSKAIVRSLEGREVEDYLSPIKNTLVYKEATKYV